MSVKYEYDAEVEKELMWCARKLFGPSASIKRATLAEDFGGVDGQFVVDQVVPFQLRTRFNRPAYAADSDITFRHTEPRMMAAKTYAPIFVNVWFTGQRIVAARCVDIYRMFTRLQPPFQDRPVIVNADERTGFYPVDISELWHMGALLKLFDGREWTTGNLGGQMRLERIIKAYKERDPKRWAMDEGDDATIAEADIPF